MTGLPQRKAPSEPGFHPSRNEPYGVGQETASGQSVFVDQGEAPARATLFGRQGRTLSRDPYESAAAENLSRLSIQEGGNGEPDWGMNELVKGLSQSTVPVSHWAGGKSGIDLVNRGLDQAGGYYRPSPNVLTAPEIGVEAILGHAPTTLLHEMGHAQHYDTVRAPKERGNPSKMYRDARGYAPDPVKEAVADAYVDRYGGHLSAAKTAGDYSHISSPQFGYSSSYEEERGDKAAWNDPDRALYAGTRAHAGETGDIPRYQKAPVAGNPVGAETDATIHHLRQHSPHARAAWDQLSVGGRKEIEPDYGFAKVSPERSMSEIAGEASRRHQDRRLLSQGQFVQESLFSEPHMARNQQGEIPRTIGQVQASLGHRHTNYYALKEKGFGE